MAGSGVERTCLHCALLRALRAEMPGLEGRGVTVMVGRSDAVWLPLSGTRIYRGIRRLLQRAGGTAARCRIRMAVVDLRGSSHVDVLATVLAPGRARVHRVAFPRTVDRHLPAGFAEAD